MHKKVFWLVAVLALLSPSVGIAAPLIGQKDTFLATDSGGASFRCASVKSQKVYVIKKGAFYVPASTLVAALQSRVNGATSAALKKKLKTKLTVLKLEIRSRDRICASPPQVNTPTPTATPTLQPTPNNPNPTVPQSLEKLDRQVTEADVVNLVDKAGFGMGSDEARLIAIGVNQGIDALVDEFMRTREEPAGLATRVDDRLDGQIGKSSTQTPTGQRQGILDIWLHTRNQYAERLAMALLGIWTVSGEVVEDKTFRYPTWAYYTRLRNYAFDQTDIPSLGVEITRDPLMLLFLNNDTNARDAYNENYARELMELFTLGPLNLDGQPNYTETKLDGSGDILAAAKLLSGWKVKKDSSISKLVSQYDAARHAVGTFTMFPGTPWQFSGQSDEDLVRGIFAHHPEAQNYYASEILKLYLTPKPSRALVEAFGTVIKSNDFKLRPAMRTLFLSGAFYSDSFKDTLPTDPFLMTARVARALRMDQAINVGSVERQTTQMGFTPNFPPSVFWYPQSAWGSSSVLLEKANLVSIILGDSNGQNSGGWNAGQVLPIGAASVANTVSFVSAQCRMGALSAAQTQSLTSFMTRQLQYDGTYTPYTYDNTSPVKQREKGLGLYFELFMSPKFQLQ